MLRAPQIPQQYRIINPQKNTAHKIINEERTITVNKYSFLITFHEKELNLYSEIFLQLQELQNYRLITLIAPPLSHHLRLRTDIIHQQHHILRHSF